MYRRYSSLIAALLINHNPESLMTTPILFYIRRNHTATTYTLSTSPHVPNCRRPPSGLDLACSLCTLIQSSYVASSLAVLCCAVLCCALLCSAELS